MPWAHVNSTQLWYEEAGRARLPALVLVHGFPLDSRVWAEQLNDLSTSARVIAPDLRGFGRSKSTDPFTMQSMADDLHGLLSQLKALPCTMAGLSMGGYVSLAYAKRYPAEVSRLILVDSRIDADSPAAKESRNQMIELARKGGSAAVTEAMLPRLLAPSVLANRPGVVKQLTTITLACPALTIEHALIAMREREDSTASLATACLPVDFIVGEHDAITPPALAREMAARIGRGEVRVIPGAGHLSPLEQPALVARAIMDCVRGAVGD